MRFSPSFAMLHKKATLGVIVSLLVSACAAPQPAATPYDPYEGTNRAMHAVNRGIDRALVRPTAKVYGFALPKPAKQGISNFAGNLDLPGDVVNGILQGDGEAAANNTLRFALNSTLGLAGLFDPASALGLTHDKTDFGETLHVWGMAEGPYVELPGLGPSTVRDTLGTVVDIAANPVSLILPTPEKYYATATKVGSRLGDRDRFAETIDSVLYDSADSYAQARLLYLQNRRFELGQTSADTAASDDFIDPYAE